MMNYQVRLRDLETGKVVDLAEDWWEDTDEAIYHLNDAGYYACDHNRAVALGVEGDFPCGSLDPPRFVCGWVKNESGEIVYSETNG